MQIQNLFDQLIKTVHDIATHQDASSVLSDIVFSTSDILTVVPGIGGAVPQIVADVMNVVTNTLAGSHDRLQGSHMNDKTDSIRPDKDPARLPSNQ